MGACRFYVYACATSIMIGSLSCVFTLQSSVQAQNGTGSLSLASYYVSAIISASIVYPILLRFLGRKYNLLLGDLSCIFFCLTLLLPSRGVPIFVNAVTGILSCSIWSAAFAIAISFSSAQMDRDSSDSGVKDLSCFVAILSFGQSLINILPEVTLQNVGSNSTGNTENYVTTNVSCGAADCPNEYSTQGDHPIYNNLVPSRISLYIFVGILTLLQIVVLVIHWVLLPNDYPRNREEIPLLANHNDNDDALLPNDKPTNHEKTPLMANQDDTTKWKWSRVALTQLKDSLANMWRNLLSPVSAFTFASQIQYGLVSGFVWLVFTRSFVSCIVGVQKVGLLALVFYFASASASFVAAKCFTGVPIRLITITRSVFDVGTFTGAIVWIPSQETFYVVYVLAVLFGICQGLSKTLAYALPVTYFKDIDAGYTLCVCWDAIGVAVLGILSVKVCTLYILYSVMIASIISTTSLLIGTCLYKENLSQST